MNNIKSFIFNKDYYREVFIAITILFAIAFFTPFSSILNLFLLAWGGILILNDLLTKRAMFKSKKVNSINMFYDILWNNYCY